MKILLIAEKPSVAKTYCQMLEQLENESFTKSTGYFKGKKYDVSYCYGHLVETDDPKAYGWETWEMDTLPMIPEKWKYRVKPDKGAKAQFKILKDLIHNSDVIINGADAAREGELIYRLVMLQAGALKKTQQRLWTNSFVLKDLKKAWNNRQDIKAYNNLFAAAMLRSKSDWLVGMNCTRAYSLATGVHGLSVGRVQTPTLNLIVQRDLEIANWTDKYFFELRATWKDINFLYKNPNGESEHLTDEALIDIEQQIKLSEGTITQIEKKEKSTSSSRPFSLSTLQQSANNNLDFTAQKTLDICQKLYESKLVTYPRTDSEYLPVNMLPEAYETLASLSDFGHNLNSLKAPGTKTAFFNDKKVSDHFAIIPTGEKPGTLSQDESNLYNLIVKRFITAFGKPFIYDETKAVLKVKDFNFYSTFRTVKDNGFKSLFKIANSPADDKLSADSLPDISIDLKKGDTDIISNTSLEKKKRTKPKHYNEATLLKAMELCGRNLDDKELTDAMKESGLGTPATRAGTIETLKKRTYITTNGKLLLSTTKGQELIKIVDDKLKSPILTGEWEKDLKQIEEGNGDWHKNIKETEQYVEQIIIKIKTNNQKGVYKEFAQTSGVEKPILPCPKCNFCQTKEPQECGFVLWPKVFGKKLSEKEVMQLLAEGKTTKPVKGMKWKDRKFEGVLIMTDDYKVQVEKKAQTKEPENTTIINCPKCNSQMKVNSKGAFCNCGVSIWRTVCGKALSDQMLITLSEMKTTPFITGLKGKKGTFTAALYLVEGKEKDYKSKFKFKK